MQVRHARDGVRASASRCRTSPKLHGRAPPGSKKSEVNGLVANFLAKKGNNALTKWITPARDRFRDRERDAIDPRRQARPRRTTALPQGRRWSISAPGSTSAWARRRANATNVRCAPAGIVTPPEFAGGQPDGSPAVSAEPPQLPLRVAAAVGAGWRAGALVVPGDRVGRRRGVLLGRRRVGVAGGERAVALSGPAMSSPAALRVSLNNHCARSIRPHTWRPSVVS